MIDLAKEKKKLPIPDSNLEPLILKIVVLTTAAKCAYAHMESFHHSLTFSSIFPNFQVDFLITQKYMARSKV